MSPHWHDENGAYCEQCAPKDIEPDYNSNEVDSPDNCQVCGRPCEYSLTTHGVAYVLDAIIDCLEESEDERNEIIGNDEVVGRRLSPSYYRGSPGCSVVRDWAEDLLNYGLNRHQKWIVEHFLEITEPRTPSR